MVRAGRVALVTLGLIGAGILFGALAGGLAFTIVTVIVGGGISAEAFGIGAFFGAPLGAITAPLLSWLLLRRVSLGRMFPVCSVGTAIGGVVGAFMPSLVGDFMLLPLVGAFLGCVVAAITLWYRARIRSGNVAPMAS